MSGTPANAALWQNADVYIAPASTAGPVDVTAAWGVLWKALGLLDGEQGFAESREGDSQEYYAWGGVLVKKTKSKHKRTIKFVCLEDNADVFALVNPGSSRTLASGVTTSSVKVPTNVDFAIGFQVDDGPDKRKRRIVKRATVEEIGEIKDSESALTAYEITVVIYPESDGTLYTEISGDPTA